MFTLWYIFLGYKELKEWIEQLQEGSDGDGDGGRQSTRKSEGQDGDGGDDGGDGGDAGEEGGDGEEGGGDDGDGGDEGEDGGEGEEGEEGEGEGEGGEAGVEYIGGTEAVVVEEGPIIEKGLKTVVEEDEDEAEEDAKYWTDANGKSSRTSIGSKSNDSSPSVSIISGQDWAWSGELR